MRRPAGTGAQAGALPDGVVDDDDVVEVLAGERLLNEYVDRGPVLGQQRDRVLGRDELRERAAVAGHLAEQPVERHRGIAQPQHARRRAADPPVALRHQNRTLGG